MPKFRKKPVVVEAIQWMKSGDHYAVGQHAPHTKDMFGDSLDHCKQCGTRFKVTLDGPSGSREVWTHGWVATLEGGHIVCPKDWIITGVKNENYPCKPDIFEATYEPVETPNGTRFTALFVWLECVLNRRIVVDDLSCENLDGVPEGELRSAVTTFRRLRADAREAAIRGHYRKENS